jgi:tetratricopeptide (TPR) repeat protein
MNANMNHRVAAPLPRVWWWTAAGASVLSAAIGLWWWIGGLVSAPAASDGAGASGEVLEQARGRLSAGDFPQARELYRQALEQQRRENYTHAAASTQEELGALEQGAGRWTAARAAYADAGRAYATLEDRTGQARVLRRLAALEFHTGRYRVALDAFERALAVQDRDNAMARVQLMVSAAEAEIRLGALDAARTRLRGARALLAGLDDYRSLARMLEAEATIELREGRVSEARSLYSAALDQYRAAGNTPGSARAIKGMGDLERRAGRGAAAQGLYRQALDRSTVKDSPGRLRRRGARRH